MERKGRGEVGQGSSDYSTMSLLASIHPLSRAGDGSPGDGVQPPVALLGGVRVPAGSWPGSRTIRRPRSRHVHPQRAGLFHITAAHAMKGGDDGEEDDGDDGDKSRALLG